MRKIVLAVVALLAVPAMAPALEEATNIHGNTPYFYTGYYQYGTSPYVVVPNYRINDANFSYSFSPYQYSYSQTGFYGSPTIRRPWSLGYLSDQYHGAYYF